ncbi:MAG: hypothetical protein NVS2B14_07950 [Chamaesiphon sp.]
MAPTHRFQILLTEEEAALLQPEANRRDISRAEIIRDVMKWLRQAQGQPT